MHLRLLASSCFVGIITICTVAAGANTSGYSQRPKAPRHAIIESVDVSTDMADEDVTVQEATSSAYSLDIEADDAYLLTKLAMAEAEGEDTVGKALVIRVALNRVWSEAFPNSISEVIFQKNQFSVTANGRFDDVEPSEDCWKALDMVLEGWDESDGATFFESRSDSTWHSENLTYLFQHGNHYFYKE
jgi:N-acetylmuramoyl-L-alanine amidase